MALKDYIHISHIGDNFFEDKELLVSKLITQHKWSDKFYKAARGYAFSVSYNNLRHIEPLYQKVFEEYERIYHAPIDKEGTKKDSYCLVQNDLRNVYIWHQHDQPHVLFSSVYYLHLPEGSGGIKFKDDFEEIEITPKEGDLFFFPPNMSHTPAHSTCKDYRISYNINFVKG